LIAWHLERLAAAGCREVVINVSHLGEQIVEAIGDGRRFALQVAYSREASPLETAGGIAQALPLLGNAPFLLVNADIYCEVAFRPLLEHDLGDLLGHLVLVANPAHRAQGDFSLRHGLVGNAPGERYTYAGVAVMSPRMVSPVKRGAKAPLAPLLYAAVEEQRLSGELFHGLWQDVGTPARLAELEAELATRT
ncbi:MAG: nucleotidyltransferase family protein, partial [Burkholderiales bacterium]